MRRSWQRRRQSLVTASVATIALVAAALAVPGTATAEPVVHPTAVDCPAPFPAEDIEPGLVGEGLTVVEESTPQPFQVTVLGVLEDGLAPGRDIIMVELDDVAGSTIISDAGGGWAGISGSPVYVGNQLLGSTSYGFTLAPSRLMGLTPAADVLDLFSDAGARSVPAARAAGTQTVHLTSAQRTRFARMAGVATPRGSLAPLVTPLGVAGAGPKVVARLQSQLDQAGLPMRAYAGGRVGSNRLVDGITESPVAGGNFLGAVSYGDLALYATGTTTAICNGEAVAYGHPLLRSGASTLGASDGSAITIVRDDTLGDYKMANLGGLFGTLDADRLGGVRANLSEIPEGSLVTTVVRNADTGASRTGSTDVLSEDFASSIAANAVFAAQDLVLDEDGDGVSSTAWSITGTRGDGTPFRMTRQNAWADRGFITIDGADELGSAIGQLLSNESEDVSIDSVVYRSTLSSRFQQLRVVKLEVSVNGGRYTSPERIVVAAGSTLRLRVSLRHFRSTATGTRTIELTVPRSARGQAGVLLAAGGTSLAGGGLDECELFGECGNDEASIDSVISDIRATPRNDALVAQLLLASEDEDDDGVAASRTQLQRLTITGQRSIGIVIR